MLAARYGVQWYEYTMKRGRDISNGALYLITSVTKCAQWGNAVFDRKCGPGQGLKFDKKRGFHFRKPTSKYCWKGSQIFRVKVANPSQGDTQNQCAFLGGYKIMLRQDIFDNLGNDEPWMSDLAARTSSPQARTINQTRQPATRIRGGGGPSFTSKSPTDESPWSPISMSSIAESDEVVLHANFSSSLVHPSDLVNSILLSQNPNAKVALTHDDVWCDLLRDNYPKFSYARLIDIARSYTNTVDEYDCVSLKKNSCASNDRNQDSHTLLEPYTSISSINCSTLPRELIERILFLLDTDSMLICRLINRRFNDIIQSSIVLQYFIACKAAGVIDIPTSRLTYGERLEALNKREDAWRSLKPTFDMTIEVTHRASANMIYGLAGGAYFLDDKNLTDVNYCRLPSSPHDNPRWTRIQGLGPGERRHGIFNNFGMAIYEHDLIMNIIISDTGGQTDIQRYSLDLVLLKFSTGEYHPLAHNHRIHVVRLPEAQPATTPEIVGDNVALVVYSRTGAFPDQLFIFNWKTGHKRLQHEATSKSYSSLVFLSQELLLVPNLVLSHFEVWHLSSNHNVPVQILSLQFPAVSSKYNLFNVSCDGGPNPFLHSIPYFPQRPFFTSRESSIIIFNFVVSSNSLFFPHALIMHCRALLDTIQELTASEFLDQLEDPGMWLTNEATVDALSDPDNGLIVFSSVSKSVLVTVSHRRSSSRTHRNSTSARYQKLRLPTIRTGSSAAPSGSLTSRYNFLPVKWADWGPPISRWLRVSAMQGLLTATSAGQRYAFAVPDSRDNGKVMISVADFNPYNFRRNAERTSRLREGGWDTNINDKKRKQEEEEEFEILDHGGVFSVDVLMGLKCSIYHAQEGYEFDQLLMDEERLLGVTMDDGGRDESIRVLYFG